MKALTIKQPWAWAIADGFKPCENRTWSTRYRGPLLIHAGQALDHQAPIARLSRTAAIRLDSLGGRNNFWNARTYVPSTAVAPPHPTLALGAVIALAHLTDIHPATDGCCAPWGEHSPGIHHWTLTDVQPLLRPVACTGRLGLWTPDDEKRSSIQRQIPEGAR